MLDKKVGIITFHDSRNYGAVLQTYALQQKILELFRNVEIIDYQNEEIAGILKLWNYSGGGLKPLLCAVPTFFFRAKKKSAFDKYIAEYLHLSKKITQQNIQTETEKYDILITGSDQVWNTALTAHDMHYFLDFASNTQCRTAYAASFGDRKILLDDTIKKLLGKLDIVTLRETLMLEEVKKFVTVQPTTCCDPTLLLTVEQWKRQISPSPLKKPYVFLFMIDRSRMLEQYAEKLASENGLKLISNKNDISFLCHAKPNDFLSWIYHANYVITNSFHGSVFSILFHKQFVSYPYYNNGKPRSRISELLQDTGLTHRTANNLSFQPACPEDWNSIDEKIQSMRTTSWNAFTQAFEMYFKEEF